MTQEAQDLRTKINQRADEWAASVVHEAISFAQVDITRQETGLTRQFLAIAYIMGAMAGIELYDAALKETRNAVTGTATNTSTDHE